MFDASKTQRPSQPRPGERPDETERWVEEVLIGASSVQAIALLKQMDPTLLEHRDAVVYTGAVERARRMLDSLLVRFQAAAAGDQPEERGVDAAAEELACQLKLNPHAAVADVGASRAIVRRLPLTLRFLEAGEISLRQARQVEVATRDLDPATAALVEADAVPGDPRRLKSRLAHARAKHAPEAEEKKTEENRSERRADFWSDPVEGLAGIAVQGPLAQLAQIKVAIDAEARARIAGECRPLRARRFDVLLGWARERLGLDDPAETPEPSNLERPAPAPAEPEDDGSPASASPAAAAPVSPAAPAAETTPAEAHHSSAGSSRCTTCGRSGRSRIPVNVTMSLATLLRLSDEPGMLDGLPIPAEVARECAADGALRRWLIEPTSGQLLDVGATTYRPNAVLDRFIRARDRTCRFPGCEHPSVRCDLDHTLAFHTENGETVCGNLVALCRRHHRLKHESDWSYRVEADGAVSWTAPSGRTYRVPPDDHGDDALLSSAFADFHARDRAKRERDQPSSPTTAAQQDDTLGTPPF